MKVKYANLFDYANYREFLAQYQKNRFTGGKSLTMTVSLSDYMLDKLGKKVEQFCSEVRSMIHKDERSSRHVYQINMLPPSQTQKG